MVIALLILGIMIILKADFPLLEAIQTSVKEPRPKTKPRENITPNINMLVKLYRIMISHS